MGTSKSAQITPSVLLCVDLTPSTYPKSSIEKPAIITNRSTFDNDMAGHSKWANIKRQKARVDAVRGKTFTQLSRAIIVAARNGIPDPAGNFQLRTAIDKAKAAGIPNDNIDRAIAKGAGITDSGSQLEEIRYEGYGMGGVAVIVEALTDNRNRTAADLRAAFTKRGGNLGEVGCVGWMFDRLGVCTIAGTVDEDRLLEAALAGGADIYEFIDDEDNPGAEVFTTVPNLEQLSATLTAEGLVVCDAEIRWIPQTTTIVTDPEQGKQLVKLIEVLEALDDVQVVTANFDLADELVDSE
jgi:YebC/PmpR family DNA-binding regulatory protein